MFLGCPTASYHTCSAQRQPKQNCNSQSQARWPRTRPVLGRFFSAVKCARSCSPNWASPNPYRCDCARDRGGQIGSRRWRRLDRSANLTGRARQCSIGIPVRFIIGVHTLASSLAVGAKSRRSRRRIGRTGSLSHGPRLCKGRGTRTAVAAGDPLGAGPLPVPSSVRWPRIASANAGTGVWRAIASNSGRRGVLHLPRGFVRRDAAAAREPGDARPRAPGRLGNPGAANRLCAQQ